MVTKLIMKETVTCVQIVATVLGSLAVLFVYQKDIFWTCTAVAKPTHHQARDVLNVTADGNRIFHKLQVNCTVKHDTINKSTIMGDTGNTVHETRRTSTAQDKFSLMKGIGLAISCGLCNTGK